jgi:Protein of unknown function (DUF3108)
LSTHEPDSTDARARTAFARRAPRLLVVIAVAFVLHAALLGGADWAWPEARSVPLPVSAMQIRVVDAPKKPVAAEAPVVSAVASELARPLVSKVARELPARSPRLSRSAVSPDAAAADPAVIAGPSREPVRAAAALPAAMLLALATPAPEHAAVAPTPASSPASAPADDEPVALYRTRPSPAITLRYEVKRGGLHGTGDLVWRPRADGYELNLDFKLGGMSLLAQSSSGAFDAGGLAPLRFTDQRWRRAAMATNFQRAAGKITYSGSSSEFPLQPGVQDRLSWMVQLAAIVSAQPQLAKPGSRIAMRVTGSHGDYGVWVFRCVGPEAVEARGGTVEAVKFVREAREAYDTTVQVWLDPKLHDLPVRATQKSGPNDDGYELRLLETLSAH